VCRIRPKAAETSCTDRAGELGEVLHWQCHVKFVRHSERRDRLGVALTVSPQAGAAAASSATAISVTPVASRWHARACRSGPAAEPRREATHRLRGPKEREEPTPREPSAIPSVPLRS